MKASLDSWLPVTLEDTEDDWMPYFDWLREEHGRRPEDQPELAIRFEQFARNELDAWSPSPPHLDELREWASDFGLPELEVQLREKQEEEEMAASETFSTNRVSPGATAARKAEDASDAELRLLFARLDPTST